MSKGLVTVFGGSGFVGRHLTRALTRRGWRVRAAVRRPDLAGHLQPLGVVGQVQAVQANLRYADSVVRAVEGADAVVNLVGILSESGRQRFTSVQARGADTVAKATAAAGIGRLVQISSIGADPDSPSDYAASKGFGEKFAREAVPGAVVIRPSIIFGPEDQFFNRFAAMAGLSPALPLIGGDTRFQPVYVGDVAEAIAQAVEGRARSGATYELGGPQVRSFRALLEYILAETGRERPLVPVPFWLARAQASILQVLPGKLLTVDQVTQLERDNVVSEGAVAEKRTLEGLGIAPTAFESVVPSYLYRYRRHGQFGRAKAV